MSPDGPRQVNEKLNLCSRTNGAAIATPLRRRAAVFREAFLGLRQLFGQAAQHDNVARAQLGGRVWLYAANAVTANRRHFDTQFVQTEVRERAANRVGILVDRDRL